MKTILIPTDFSAAANNAAEYAAHIAKDLETELLLLHVYHVPLPVANGTSVIISEDELQREKESELRRLAAHLRKISNLNIRCKTVMGFAADEILNEEKNVSYIVMGMQGAGGLSETLMGSITTTVMHRTHTPLIIVPAKVSYRQPKQIVFATDYDRDTNMHTLDPLITLMKPFESKLYVINVKEKQEVSDIDETIAGLRMETKLRDVEHIYHFPEKKDLVEGINEFVLSNKADMVAMVPHRYGLLEGLFHKSISKRVAFHTQVPMLALPDIQVPLTFAKSH
jgi:nucleotide-binding universal stress UspA family protein